MPRPHLHTVSCYVQILVYVYFYNIIQQKLQQFLHAGRLTHVLLNYLNKISSSTYYAHTSDNKHYNDYDNSKYDNNNNNNNNRHHHITETRAEINSPSFKAAIARIASALETVLTSTPASASTTSKLLSTLSISSSSSSPP